MTDATPRMTSHRPYLLRALSEWIADNDMTPHLLVDATHPGVQQRQHATQGRIGLRGASSRCKQRRQHAIQPRARRIGQGAHARGARDRPDERDQLALAQHQPPHMAIDAVVGILEAEAALEAQPAIFAAPQT